MTKDSKKPDMPDLPPELKEFRKKWEGMKDKQKIDTLINMVMSVAYRMDILASVVSGIPAVKDMEDAAKEQIKKAQKSTVNDKS